MLVLLAYVEALEGMFFRLSFYSVDLLSKQGGHLGRRNRSKAYLWVSVSCINPPTPACQGSTGCENTSWRGTLYFLPNGGGTYILPFWPGRPGCCKLTTRKSHKIPTRQKVRPDGQESPQDGSKTAKKPQTDPNRTPNTTPISPQTVEILK